MSSLPRFKSVELAGEVICLRPVRREDAGVAYPMVRDDRVTRSIMWDGPASVAELAKAYRERADAWRTGGDYMCSIERAADRVFIGSVGAHVLTHTPNHAEIGYWIGVEHRGKGYASDAVRLISHFAFSHLDVVRVAASVFAGNEASRRALEKNGFSLDGTLRRHLHKRGQWLDTWFFTLLREEWEADRGRYAPAEERVARV